jgi:predicted metal-dependent phosphotriesterase family hydrolase
MVYCIGNNSNAMETISRRAFLMTSVESAAGVLMTQRLFAGPKSGEINTVRGEIGSGKAGFVLSHEHILVDFIGADQTGKHRYNADEVFDTALPYLQEIQKLGCDTFVDCTPAYIGRDPSILKRLSKKTGLNIITNTGYYGAAKEKYLPPLAYTETAQQLAERWIKEFHDGIENTGIRPGFIKTGVDQGPLTEVQRKLVEAAAITHLVTGLTIAIHTGDGNAAEEELEILEANGVSLEARIWVHAQNEADREFHFRAGRKKGYVSFDGVNPETIDKNITFLKNMKAENLLDRVLVSQDSGWFNVGEPRGGNFKPYSSIFKDFLPAMKANSFTQEEVDLIFRENPARALTISVRRK